MCLQKEESRIEKWAHLRSHENGERTGFENKEIRLQVYGTHRVRIPVYVAVWPTRVVAKIYTDPLYIYVHIKDIAQG